jgi:hypothetical protein
MKLARFLIFLSFSAACPKVEIISFFSLFSVLQQEFTNCFGWKLTKIKGLSVA